MAVLHTDNGSPGLSVQEAQPLAVMEMPQDRQLSRNYTSNTGYRIQGRKRSNLAQDFID